MSIALGALALATFLPADSTLQRFAVREIHLGVEIRITAWVPNDSVARLAARAAFSEIARLEDVFSDWRPTSELRRLGGAPGAWQPVSPELFEVLSIALEVARLSDGAFDPTVGPLTVLWRTARDEGRPPADSAIATARRSVGFRHVNLDTTLQRVRLALPGMRLDLGGVAKGFILQRAFDVMVARGLRRTLIQGGGDIVAGDPPPRLDGWRVDAPDAGPALARIASALHRAALATSGPSEQSLVVAGDSYSHVLDPGTGWGLNTGTVATVAGPNAAIADAVATALTLITPAQGARLLSHFGLKGEARRQGEKSSAGPADQEIHCVAAGLCASCLWCQGAREETVSPSQGKPTRTRQFGPAAMAAALRLRR
jgi:thiamine biosynthesis lipoprotein